MNILYSIIMICIAQISLAKVSECSMSQMKNQILQQALHEISNRYGAVSNLTTYSFGLAYQIESKENLKPLNGEDQLTYRKRLIALQKSKVSKAEEVFFEFLKNYKLSHVFIPGPKNLKMWVIKANTSELEFILNASDACEINQIVGVMIN